MYVQNEIGEWKENFADWEMDRHIYIYDFNDPTKMLREQRRRKWAQRLKTTTTTTTTEKTGTHHKTATLRYKIVFLIREYMEFNIKMYINVQLNGLHVKYF